MLSETSPLLPALRRQTNKGSPGGKQFAKLFRYSNPWRTQVSSASGQAVGCLGGRGGRGDTAGILELCASAAILARFLLLQ